MLESLWNKLEQWDFRKKVIFIPAVLLMFVIVGYLMLVGVYCLPTNRMELNLQASGSLLAEEGRYPLVMDGENSQLDNSTDTLMLLTASYPENKSVWKAAINAKRYNASPAMVEELYQNGEVDANTVNYTRYWHGYLVVLKPLMLFFNYGQIRSLIMCVQLGIFTLLMVKISKRDNRLLFPIFIVMIFMNVTATSLSLQYNTVLLISMIAMLVMLYLEKICNSENIYAWGLYFLTIGVATSYFDLLTYPLVSLGLPLVLWIVLSFSEKIVNNFKNIIQFSLFWGVGFGAMWASKWILGSLVTGQNLITDAVENIILRTSSDFSGDVITYLDVVKAQIRSMKQVPFTALVFILFILFIVYVLKGKRIRWNLILTMAVIGLFPFAWYFVLKNHSLIHSWFTYREMAITVFAASSCIMMHGGTERNG